MNREQVIEWARSLHLIDFRDKDTDPAIVDVIDSLVELVRIAESQERETCAELMERQHTWITNVAASTLIRACGQKEGA